MGQKPTVFIHTNSKQLLGALVAAFSMKNASLHPNLFDVKLICLEDTPHLTKRQGQKYLRKGNQAVWLNEDLQSFSPLRKMVPQLMGFKGRAVVTDPDVFAIADIYELLTMDMEGKAIKCRNVIDGYKSNGNAFYASSVMLLDCEKLAHWRWDEDIDCMFAGEMDYGPWIGLKNEDPETIGEIGEEWNSFDKLTPDTKLLHTTERLTQPWRTGLPIDFDLTTKKKNIKKVKGVFGSIVSLFVKDKKPGVEKLTEFYKPNPDPAQERFFFSLLKGALEAGYVEEDAISAGMKSNDLRHDAFDVLKSIGYVPQTSKLKAM